MNQDRSPIHIIERRLTQIIPTDVRDYLRKWVPLSILIGLVGGIGALIFQLLLEFVWALSYETVSIPWFLIALVPAVGGLLAGLIISHTAPETEGAGTDAVIDALHHHGGRMRPLVAPVKIVASALTIGTGGSAGREGPISQITGGLASFVGTKLKLSRSDLRIFIISGMAAGFSAVFKAPLGAAVFAMEIPYKNDLESNAVIPSILSSVVAYLTFMPFYGTDPIFAFPTFVLAPSLDLFPFIILVGFVAGLVGLAFIKMLFKVRESFRSMRVPLYQMMALGGLLTGIIGLALPSLLGLGEGLIQSLIDGGIVSIVMLLAILVGKMVATSFTVGSGGSGGVFFPSLIVGGAVGGLVAEVFGLGSTSILVLVGMAAMMAGMTKTPVATPIMMTEMVGGTTVIIPLMVASAIAYVITGSRTIYESQIGRSSFQIDVSLLSKVRVRDVMRTGLITIPLEASIADAYQTMLHHPHYLYPVVDAEGRVVGVLPRDLIERRVPTAPNDPITSIMQTHYDTITEDRWALDAFDLMNSKQISRMLVVDPKDWQRVTGIITRLDLMEALEHLDERHHEY